MAARNVENERPRPGEQEVQLIGRRIAIAATAACTTLALLAPSEARAGLCVIPALCKSPTPTPSPSSSSAPSSSPKPKPKPRPSSKPSSAPSPAQNGSGYNGSGPTPYTGLRGAIRFVLDTIHTARNTQHLLDLLTRLKGDLPLTQTDIARGFGRFPVLGYVWYQNDYGAPRYLPYFHLHEGVDLFATAGTPVSACADGVVAKLANGSIGGISFWLAGDDGITYYYGHLTEYAPGLVAGKRVRVGDILGFVGDTGVAQGTSPHLHFEMHPGGGPPVSPKAVLDGWLQGAERSAVNAYARIVEHNMLNRVGAARWQSVFDLLREPAAPVVPLWPLALDPSATALGVDAAFDAIAWGLDVRPAEVAGGLGSDEVAAPMFDPATMGPAWLAPSPPGASTPGTVLAVR